MDRSDGDLVRAAQAGDTASYAELVRRHQATAFRAAFLITRSAHDAEEAAQDGFVKAWKALDRFRVEAPFRPWLLRIVKNEALNRIRSRGRRERLALRVADEPLPDQRTPEAAAVSSEDQARVLAAIDQLPDHQRQVITALHLLELSEAEAAAMLGLKPGTVKSRSARARRRLADILRETEDD